MDNDFPKLYLKTPKNPDYNTFPKQLSVVLDSFEIACLRIEFNTRNDLKKERLAEILRKICNERDVSILINHHIEMSLKLGLDGVHLFGGCEDIRKARQKLGKNSIIGVYCGSSKHSGLVAGEAGADYISFGPLKNDDQESGKLANLSLFQWWNKIIELPVVAEGGVNLENFLKIHKFSDFVALDAEIWDTEDPKTTIEHFYNLTSKTSS